MNKFLLGWALAQTLITVICIFLLYKKPTVVNEIENLKQKNKRNKQSNIQNDITPTINQDNSKERKKWPRNGLFNRLKEKRLTKKQNK